MLKFCVSIVRFFSIVLLMTMTGGIVAAQQNYPTKPVRLIVPFPPGGGNDILARIFGQKLSQLWGKSIIVDNRPGGNTIIGTEALTHATPDGYTLMLTSSSHVILPSLLKLSYDPIKDFAPVGTISSAELILAVHSSVPANTLKEFISLAKSQPGKLNYASGGTGNPNHLAAEMFNIMAGVGMVHIPYKGGGPALNDLVGGQVQLFFVSPVAVLPYLTTGKVKAIAISGDHRQSALPDIPTFTESGLPHFEVQQWYGILAPAGIPKVVVEKISADIAKVLAMPDIKEKIATLGMETLVSTPEQFAELMSSDLVKYRKIIKEANIKMRE